MKLIACYSVYNEAKYLEESLKSIKGKVDYIVVVDGAYKNFPHIKPYSTDDTIKIARRYADQVILNPMKPNSIAELSWENQIQKRNKYLIGDPGDVYLAIDGHEIWYGELSPPFGNCRIKTIKGNYNLDTFRMYVHEDGIEYRNKHYEVWVGEKLLNDEYTLYTKGYFVHKEDAHDEERLKAKKQYILMDKIYKIDH
jgi:hypothetical protein